MITISNVDILEMKGWCTIHVKNRPSPFGSFVEPFDFHCWSTRSTLGLSLATPKTVGVPKTGNSRIRHILLLYPIVTLL